MTSIMNQTPPAGTSWFSTAPIPNLTDVCPAIAGAPIREYLRDKEILITGGTGSLGKTLTKILIKEGYHPRGVRIFSRDELKQWQMRLDTYNLQAELGTDVKVSYIIGDVREYQSLYRAMENVDVVINAAAMKQVPACEDNPIEAVLTNVTGAENVIKAALARDVSRVMHVSTDKAVHAVNLYGATKAVAEKLFIHANVYSGRKDVRFGCCRYGNVLGSRGSIVPLFRQQVEEGRPLTVTDPKMTRFWITLPQVARFLLGRVCEMEGGEIFVPDMYSMRVMDMARAMAPREDYPIKVTGIRPGEKIHECLIAPQELCGRRADHRVVSRLGKMSDGYYSNTNEKWLTKEQFGIMLEEAV